MQLNKKFCYNSIKINISINSNVTKYKIYTQVYLKRHRRKQIVVMIIRNRKTQLLKLLSW